MAGIPAKTSSYKFRLSLPFIDNSVEKRQRGEGGEGGGGRGWESVDEGSGGGGITGWSDNCPALM